MVGPDARTRGGMASVEHLILELSSERDDLVITHVATYREGPVLIRCAAFLKGFLLTLGYLLRRDADVVHIHFASRGSTWRKLIVALSARILNYPVVLHAHGAEYREFYTALPRVLQRLVTRLLRAATLLVVLSESWRRYYSQEVGMPESRIRVLPNPVKIPPMVPDRRERLHVTIVFLGVVSKRKGIYDLIRAVSQLSEESKASIRLVIAGDGELGHAKALATTLGVNDLIEFSGWISPEERDRLLKEADIFVLPSYAEGLPMAVLEAMAWGLPTITTPVGGNPEIIEHEENGLFVEPGNVDQLRATIKYLISSPDKRRHLGENARRMVAPLHASLYLEKLVKAYETAIRIRHGGTR